jgi:hypothetical protein
MVGCSFKKHVNLIQIIYSRKLKVNSLGLTILILTLILLIFGRWDERADRAGGRGRGLIGCRDQVN